MLKLNAYQLKWIAIIGMILSHMLIAWWDIIPVFLRFPMYISGGFTFPIMAYFVAEGYKHTSNLKKYILRILVVGLIAMPLHIIALSIPFGGGFPLFYPWLNIMFSIATGLLILKMYDSVKTKAIFWLIYIIVIVPISLLTLEWYFIGVTMILMNHIIRNETARRVVPPVFAGVCMSGIALMSADAGVMVSGLPEGMEFFLIRPEFVALQTVFGLGCVLAGLLLLGYNGERGPKSKWLFYIFYPVHFFLLGAVGLALGLFEISWIGVWFGF